MNFCVKLIGNLDVLFYQRILMKHKSYCMHCYIYSVTVHFVITALVSWYRFSVSNSGKKLYS